VLKLHFTCGNHTRACRIHTRKGQDNSRVYIKHTLRVKSYSACGKRTLRVETNIVRAEITLVPVEVTLCV
jgi:hypothetical protein